MQQNYISEKPVYCDPPTYLVGAACRTSFVTIFCLFLRFHLTKQYQSRFKVISDGNPWNFFKHEPVSVFSETADQLTISFIFHYPNTYTTLCLNKIFFHVNCPVTAPSIVWFFFNGLRCSVKPVRVVKTH